MIIDLAQKAFEKLSPLQRSTFSACMALLGYGSWAYMVNSMHGAQAAIKAACVQGGYSFALTFVMTMLIEGLYRALHGILLHTKSTAIATVLLTCAILYSTSWWINAMAGTPEIFNTVILGYIVGGVYTASYVKGLTIKQPASNL